MHFRQMISKISSSIFMFQIMLKYLFHVTLIKKGKNTIIIIEKHQKNDVQHQWTRLYVKLKLSIPYKGYANDCRLPAKSYRSCLIDMFFFIAFTTCSTPTSVIDLEVKLYRIRRVHIVIV